MQRTAAELHAYGLAKKYGKAKALEMAKEKYADLLFMVVSQDYRNFWLAVQEALR